MKYDYILFYDEWGFKMSHMTMHEYEVLYIRHGSGCVLLSFVVSGFEAAPTPQLVLVGEHAGAPPSSS